MNDMAAALSKPENLQPDVTFHALEALVNEVIGVRLFTVMERDAARGVSWRSYSNMPDAYPVTGEKPFHADRWTETVVNRGETFVANSVEEFADVFSDYELIRSLGCESCLNLPIVIGGELRGTLNCLHDAGHFTPERIAAAENLKLPGAAAFLMAAATRNAARQRGEN